MAFIDYFKKQQPIISPTVIQNDITEKQSFNYIPKQYDYGKPYQETYNGKFVYFGIDNLYPNVLADIYNRSGLHSSIVKFKKELISGGDIEVIGLDNLETGRKLNAIQYINYIDGKHSLSDLISDLTLDYLLYGAIYVKITWNVGKTKVVKMERMDPAKIRIDIDRTNPDVITNYLYNFNWREYSRYITTSYPAYSNKSDSPVEIISFSLKNPNMLWYAIPEYSAGVNWMELDGEISNYHKSNIENSINPSMALNFYQLPANEEEKRTILSSIKRNFQGSTNTGRAMVFFSDGRETAPEVKPIEVSNIDKQFNITADQIQRNICYAHQINPMIMGLKTPGSLGNSAELDTSYDIFINSYVKPTQKDMSGYINKLLSIANAGITVKLTSSQIYVNKNIL
jgi:hypothetical protein